MPLPTDQSEGQKLADLVTQGATLMASMRAQCVAWKASMAAGNVNAELIEQIANYLAVVLPKLQAMRRKAGFVDEYARHVGPAFLFDNADVNTGTNRLINMDDHVFAVDDQVVFRLIDGTLPAPFAADTQYWIVTAPAATLQLSNTQSGAVIDITAAGSGRSELLFNVNPVWGAITNPTTGFIAAIQTELAAMDKVDASGWHQARQIDAAQPDGYSHNTYTSVETATLQTKLQDLIDGIRAPV